MGKSRRVPFQPARSLLGGLAVMIAFGFPLQAKPLPSISPEAVADRLTGLLIYENEGESPILMRTCSVKISMLQTQDSVQPSTLMLYQEQARQDRLNQPYRQRFLILKPINSLTVASESYRPIEPQPWVGLCERPESERIVSDSDLLPAHCTVTLTQQGKNFVGTTPESGCPSQFRGATSVHNQIILTPKGMKTFDQGFDKTGKLIWGSDGEPYTFKKIES